MGNCRGTFFGDSFGTACISLLLMRKIFVYGNNEKSKKLQYSAVE
jgi:hypothetical protein